MSLFTDKYTLVLNKEKCEQCKKYNSWKKPIIYALLASYGYNFPCYEFCFSACISSLCMLMYNEELKKTELGAV